MKKFDLRIPKLGLCLLGLSLTGSIQAQEIEDLLDMSLEDLMNVEITSATKTSQSLADAPAIITVVTAQQIKSNGYQNVAEVLQNIVGFDVITDHFQPNVGVRGINGGLRSYSRIIKVMIDGQTIANRSTADNYLDGSLIPIRAISRIEVIKGPNSALYGADAYLGVVNIITKSGDELSDNIVSTKIGKTQDNVSSGGSGVLGGTKGKLEYMLSASYENIDRSGLAPVDIPQSTIYTDRDDASSNDISRPFSVYAKLKYNMESNGDLLLDFSHRHVDAYGEFQDWGVLTGNNRISLRNSFIRGKYQTGIGEKMNASIGGAYSTGAPTKYERLSIGIDDWIERDMEYKSIDANADLQYQLNDLSSITIGADFIRDGHTHQTYKMIDAETKEETINFDWVKENFNIPDAFTNTGVFAQAILGHSGFDKLGVTLGARFDNHSVYGSNTNYRAVLVYKFTEKTYSKLMYGTSFRAPSSSQLYTNFIKTGGVIGNPDLEPERANIIDFQIAGQIMKNLYFNLDIYKNTTSNKVELGIPQNAVTSNVRALNLAEINSQGIEAELMANFAGFNTYANYAYQKSTLSTERTNEPGVKYEGDVNLYPSHMVKFGVNKTIAKKININLQGRYTDSRIASNPNTQAADKITYLFNYGQYFNNRYRIDYYTVLDMTLSAVNLKAFGENETELFLKVYNLLDQDFAYPGFRYDYDIPGLGRQFIVSVVQHF